MDSSKGVTKAGLEQYIVEGKAWETEIYSSAKRSRNIAWATTVFLMVCTLMAIIALILVMPLKERIPYIIEVDEISGMVEVRRSIIEGGISENEAITKFFIVKYLQAREQYLADTAQKDYVVVQKLSSRSVAQRYFQYFSPDNPKSPLNILGKKGRMDIKIRNISFVDADTVTIPIKRTVIRPGQKHDSYDVITLSFKYTQDPLSEEDRNINPLGFQVTAYRVDPQLLNGDSK